MSGRSRIAAAVVLVVVGLILGLAGCRNTTQFPGVGFIEVPGGRVWYQIVGKGPGTPLLVLHGGPGVPHNYLKPLAALGDERPVIFYDQLGSGRSDHPSDTTLWRTTRFVEELARVRDDLGLKEVHLYGHSWGTILALEYMLTDPGGVKSLIMGSPVLSLPRYARDADTLLALMPDSIRIVIEQHEEAQKYDTPEYAAATLAYYRQYLVRRQPWSADVDTMFAQVNPSLYVYMNGPSEFSMTGTLRDYDQAERLEEIDVPILFTVGRFDTARPTTVQLYQSFAKNSELAIFESSGHLTMQDEPERYVQVLRDFLRRVESNQRTGSNSSGSSNR